MQQWELKDLENNTNNTRMSQTCTLELQLFSHCLCHHTSGPHALCLYVCVLCENFPRIPSLETWLKWQVWYLSFMLWWSWCLVAKADENLSPLCAALVFLLFIFLSHLLASPSLVPSNSLFSLFSAQVSNVMSEQWPIVFYWAAHVLLSISLSFPPLIQYAISFPHSFPFNSLPLLVLDGLIVE